MSNQPHALAFPVISCDPHFLLFNIFVLTLKMVKCSSRVCISIKETTSAVPDQLQYIDQKTEVNYVKGGCIS